MSVNLAVGSDLNVTWDGATAPAGTYLNAATVTYALTLADGATQATCTAVAGGTGTLSYVAASNGNYLGVIESTVSALLAAGTLYYIWLTFVQGAYNDLRRVEAYAQYRGES